MIIARTDDSSRRAEVGGIAMTAEARTTEGKNSRVIRAGPWDDFMQRRGNGDDDGRSARQGNVWCDAMQCTTVRCRWFGRASVVYGLVGRT